MKTRAEIYGNEAADLLRTVTMYPGLSEQQLLCFHPGKEDTAKALLSHLERPCGAIREAAAALFWSIHRRRSPKSTVPAFPGSAP